jgi:hypothetical protein
VPLEIHRGVQDADDFQRFVPGAEEDDVATFGRDPAFRKQFLAEPVAERIGSEGFDAGPDLPEVTLLLFQTPVFQRVSAD